MPVFGRLDLRSRSYGFDTVSGRIVDRACFVPICARQRPLRGTPGTRAYREFANRFASLHRASVRFAGKFCRYSGFPVGQERGRERREWRADMFDGGPVAEVMVLGCRVILVAEVLLCVGAARALPDGRLAAIV
jgi:hypothetical protein